MNRNLATTTHAAAKSKGVMIKDQQIRRIQINTPTGQAFFEDEFGPVTEYIHECPEEEFCAEHEARIGSARPAENHRLQGRGSPQERK